MHEEIFGIRWKRRRILWWWRGAWCLMPPCLWARHGSEMSGRLVSDCERTASRPRQIPMLHLTDHQPSAGSLWSLVLHQLRLQIIRPARGKYMSEKYPAHSNFFSRTRTCQNNYTELWPNKLIFQCDIFFTLLALIGVQTRYIFLYCFATVWFLFFCAQMHRWGDCETLCYHSREWWKRPTFT